MKNYRKFRKKSQEEKNNKIKSKGHPKVKIKMTRKSPTYIVSDELPSEDEYDIIAKFGDFYLPQDVEIDDVFRVLLWEHQYDEFLHKKQYKYALYTCEIISRQ